MSCITSPQGFLFASAMRAPLFLVGIVLFFVLRPSRDAAARRRLLYVYMARRIGWVLVVLLGASCEASQSMMDASTCSGDCDPACTPAICEDAEASCGAQPDGCGGTLVCGPCDREGCGECDPPGGGTASEVSQWGITWTFDGSYEVGQFVNGDYWVVGPVTIIDITRPHDLDGHDGSMINPTSGVQAYDEQVRNYDAARDVSQALPATLEAGQSLVSTITWLPDDPGAPDVNTTANAPRPTVRTASVLTVLGEAPPADAFRPPYAGDDKPIYTASQLRLDRLPSVAPVDDRPNLEDVMRSVQRVWLDHNPEWSGAYTIPQENMPHYGREVSTTINNAMLMLMQDLPDREQLLHYVVQVGIDLYGTLRAGQYWGTWGGGWSHGRKMPILFAGRLLDDPGMLNIGVDYTQQDDCSNSNLRGCHRFQEDCQTFYVSGTMVGWGGRHCSRGDYDMEDPYRTCCTSRTWPGAMLVALMMDARESWNWEPFFDYVDFWVDEQGIDGDRTFSSSLARNMWVEYRDDY